MLEDGQVTFMKVYEEIRKSTPSGKTHSQGISTLLGPRDNRSADEKYEAPLYYYINCRFNETFVNVFFHLELSLTTPEDENDTRQGMTSCLPVCTLCPTHHKSEMSVEDSSYT